MNVKHLRELTTYLIKTGYIDFEDKEEIMKDKVKLASTVNTLITQFATWKVKVKEAEEDYNKDYVAYQVGKGMSEGEAWNALRIQNERNNLSQEELKHSLHSMPNMKAASDSSSFPITGIKTNGNMIIIDTKDKNPLIEE